MNILEIKKYCATLEHYIGRLDKPFVIDDYVYATDAHNCIRVQKSEFTSNEIEQIIEEQGMKFPLADKIYKELPIRAVIDNGYLSKIVSESLSEFNKKYRHEPEAKCPDCTGGGEVEFSYEDTDSETHYLTGECPVCKGEGIIPAVIEIETGKICDIACAAIIIDKTGVKSDYVKMAADIFGDGEVEVMYSLDTRNPIRMKQGCIDILIAPIAETDREYIVSTKLTLTAQDGEVR